MTNSTINPALNDHIVKSYNEEQQRLIQEIVNMGEMAVSQLEAALDIIENPNEINAKNIIDNDKVIDQLETTISHDVMRLALRGPMARDLREILVGIRVPAAIERIGDYASNAAKRSMALNVLPPIPNAPSLRPLGELAAFQVREALVAYRNNDTEHALKIREGDAKLDQEYTVLFRQLLLCMMEHPQSITAGTHLLFIAKNLERIGDHATNIAENVWFLVTGDNELPQREKRDKTHIPE